MWPPVDQSASEFDGGGRGQRGEGPRRTADVRGEPEATRHPGDGEVSGDTGRVLRARPSPHWPDRVACPWTSNGGIGAAGTNRPGFSWSDAGLDRGCSDPRCSDPGSRCALPESADSLHLSPP
jgi:hypothetical protein